MRIPAGFAAAVAPLVMVAAVLSCTSTRDPSSAAPTAAPPAPAAPEVPAVAEAPAPPADPEPPVDCAGRRAGETWKEDCNHCTCEKNGQITCTTMACAPVEPP